MTTPGVFVSSETSANPLDASTLDDNSLRRVNAPVRTSRRAFPVLCLGRAHAAPTAAGLVDSTPSATMKACVFPTAERYRSGRNGGASKASCRVSGTWVRIPPSPPAFAHVQLAQLSSVSYGWQASLQAKVVPRSEARRNIRPQPREGGLSPTLASATQFRCSASYGAMAPGEARRSLWRRRPTLR